MINQYVTAFAKGVLTNEAAYNLLNCDTDSFFEACTGKTEMTDDEFIEYRTVLIKIQANPLVRNLLRKLAKIYETEMELQIEEAHEEFNYRRREELHFCY